MIGLTPRQAELLRFIDRYQRDSGGLSPSYVEMMGALGLTSTGSSYRLAAGLEERGYIRRRPNRARAIEIIRSPIRQAVERLAVIYAEADLDHRSALKRASYAAEQTALEVGRVPSGPGSQASPGAADASPPIGFDPSRGGSAHLTERA